MMDKFLKRVLKLLGINKEVDNVEDKYNATWWEIEIHSDKN